MSEYTFYSYYDLSGGRVGDEVWVVQHKGKNITVPLKERAEAERIAAALNAQPQADQTDWHHIARVQSAKLAAALNEPGAQERLDAALLAAKQPRPQASAEDVMFVDELLRQSGLAGPTMKAAWQRIKASLGVVK